MITSFVAGQLSPRLDGRIDIEKYASACKELTNFIVWPHGVAQNRSGSKFINSTKDNGVARFIPFIESANAEYMLEVGNEYIRVFKNKAQLNSIEGFLAIGQSTGVSGAYMLDSPDGTTWTERNNPKNFELLGITYSSDLGLFCAVGVADGTDGYLVTSPDAVNWTERSNPKNVQLNDVVWSSGLSLFCAVGEKDGTDAYLITSPDGITWTEQSNPKNIDLKGITWSSDLDLFVAVGDADGSDGYVVTSPDGTNWTERSNPKNLGLRDVAWSDDLDLFVAVGEADGSDAYMVTSPDGTNWTERSNPKNFRLNGVAWSDDLDLFCAVGFADGSDGYVVTSPDGTNWTERSNPKNFNLQRIAYSSELTLFCAVGLADGSDAYIVTSPDGTTWTEQSNSQNLNLQAITNSAALPVEIVSPYLTADLFDIQFEQKENIMYLTHGDHPTQQLTRVSDTSWFLQEVEFSQQPLTNFKSQPVADISINAVDTGLNNWIRITASATVFKSADIGKTIEAGSGRAVISYLLGDSAATGTDVVAISTSDFDAAFYSSGDWDLIDGGIFQLNPSGTGPVGASIDLVNDAAIDTAQSLITAGAGEWTISGTLGNNTYYLAVASALLPGADPGAQGVLEKGEIMTQNQTGLAGAGLAVGEWGWDDRDTLGADTVYVRLTDEVDPDTYKSGAAGDRRHWLVWVDTAVPVAPIVTAYLSTTLPNEVGGYIIIRSGLVKITAETGTRTYRGKVIAELSSADATSIWTLHQETWNATDGYPRNIVFDEDRLYLAGTETFPLTLWGSAVGDYINHIPTVTDSSAVEFTLNAKGSNAIRWMESRDTLIAGTEGGEWVVGERGTIITPSNIFARRQTNIGSDNPFSMIADNSILFIAKGDKKIYDISFAFESDSYPALDRTILSEDITGTGIVQMTFQRIPIPIVWACTEDGAIIGMTFLRNEQVVAWHKHGTGITSATGVYDGSDSVESVEVISDANGVKELWAIINRTVNGNTVRYIEIFDNVFDTDTVTDGRFLDSYEVSSPVGTTVTGLDHLIAEKVTYIIDGDSTKVGTATVNGSGEITISSIPATSVVVGLAKKDTLRTMRIEAGGERGPAQGETKRIWEVGIRLFRAIGGKIGPDVDNLEDIKDVATLTTGDSFAKFPKGWETDGIVTVVQDQPLPITISALMVKLRTNENP